MASKKPRIPLHIQVARQLRREIARLRRPGDRLDSEMELARRFSTSVLTVREALSMLAEQGVLDRRHGSGTYVADPLARQHVAIFIDLDIAHPRTSYFHLRLIQQLRQMCRAAGYRTRLYVGETQPGQEWDGNPTCPEFLESVLAGDVCGVAAVATEPGQWAAKVEQEGIPIVGNPPTFEYSVFTDQSSMIRQGVERLILCGRKRIAYMGFASAAEHIFRDILQTHGLPFHPEWYRGDMHPSSEGAGWEEFREVWLGRREKPDGLLVADDMLLLDAAAAIMELDVVVPGDLMIVSHMNRGSMVVPPFPVDRMEFDPDLVAVAMGDRLLRLMRQEPIDQPSAVLGFTWRLAGDRTASKTIPSNKAFAR